MRIRKYGAIDIGSNAMRLLISNVIEHETEVNFNKVSLVRLPVRLGQEAFTNRSISRETLERLIDGMQAFKYILKVHGIDNYRACATAAMRELIDSTEVISGILTKTGIEIEIIDGQREADLIFKAHLKNALDEEVNYIYVDVGGGSVEISIFSKGRVASRYSFKVGTIRLLNDMVTRKKWNEMKDWVKEKTRKLEHVEMIGSGGNINKVYKLLGKVRPQPLLYNEMRLMKKQIKEMSYEELIQKFRLNSDRADVIKPAMEIYSSIMKWSDSSILHVPQLGIADGIISMMYENDLAREKEESLKVGQS